MLENSQIPGYELLERNGDEASSRLTESSPDYSSLIRSILGKLKADKNAWPFLEPVDADEVPEYYEAIHFPIDLATIGERLRQGYYVHVCDYGTLLSGGSW